MKTLILSLLFLSSLAQANEKIVVMGQEVDAVRVSRMDGQVHTFEVASPVTFTLARGNQVRVDYFATLHKNGNLSLVIPRDPLLINWKTADGRVVELSCNARFVNGIGELARTINFFDNMEYHRGCGSVKPVAFDTLFGRLEVSGDIDVMADFRLEWAQFVDSGELMIQGQPVAPGVGEIAFYPSGAPRFFKPKLGSSFTQKHALYGELRFTQLQDQMVTYRFFEDGRVARGILGSPVFHKIAGLELPAGTGVIFNDDGSDISDMLFAQTIRYQADKAVVPASRVGIDFKNKYINLLVAEPFKFVPQGSDKAMTVPVNAMVGLDFERHIVGVALPKESRGGGGQPLPSDINDLLNK